MAEIESLAISLAQEYGVYLDDPFHGGFKFCIFSPLFTARAFMFFTNSLTGSPPLPSLCSKSLPTCTANASAAQLLDPRTADIKRLLYSLSLPV